MQLQVKVIVGKQEKYKKKMVQVIKQHHID